MVKYGIVTITFSFLVSCGRNHDDIPEVVYNCSANTVEIASLQEELPAFEKSSGIRIKLSPFSGDEKLIAMIAAGQAPDIFYTNNTMRDRFASEGHLLDLKSIPEMTSLLEKLRKVDVDRSTSVDGGIYALSNWTFTSGVYYNRAIFDSLKISYPDSSWTWDEMVEIARQLTVDTNGDGKTDRYGIFIGSHFIEAFEQMNHAPIQRNALYLSISEESQEVYQKYMSLMKEGIMPDLRRVQAMGMQASQMLESGRVAMLVEAVPNIGLQEMLNIDWGVAVLPRFGQKVPRYFRAGSGGLSVSLKTKNISASIRTLEWIISKARFYQPNPILSERSFADEWEKKYPHLKNRGMREVWLASERYDGGDVRYFVRFSSWTSQSILEQLQPKLDQLWAGNLMISELVASVPTINARAKRELEAVLLNPGIKPSFRTAIESEIARSR